MELTACCSAGMKYFTGIDGSFYADGNKIARVSAWTFAANAAALNTTTLGDFATTAILWHPVVLW